MIALKIPLSNTLASIYKDSSFDHIDEATNELVISCDANGVTVINTRVGSTIKKITTPTYNRRDVKYDFIPDEWEFSTMLSIAELQLLTELESQYPQGIPCKNYLEGTSPSNPFKAMDIKFLSVERQGMNVNLNGTYAPFGGVTIKIVRVSPPVQ